MYNDLLNHSVHSDHPRHLWFDKSIDQSTDGIVFRVRCLFYVITDAHETFIRHDYCEGILHWHGEHVPPFTGLPKYPGVHVSQWEPTQGKRIKRSKSIREIQTE